MKNLIDNKTRHGINVTDTNNGRSYAFSKEHPNFEKLKVAINHDDPEAFRAAYEEGQAIRQYFADTKLTVEDGGLVYDGESIDTQLADRIFDYIDAQEDPTHLINFVERLQQNPSLHSRRQLFSFLSKGDFPITEEGLVLGYKKVRDDYLDYHSKSYDNRPGNSHTMPRRDVSDDPASPCDAGFHIGTLGYAKNFHGHSGRVVLVSFDPKDAVSVPKGSEKLRVCAYTVQAEYSEQDMSQPVYR